MNEVIEKNEVMEKVVQEIRAEEEGVRRRRGSRWNYGKLE